MDRDWLEKCRDHRHFDSVCKDIARIEKKQAEAASLVAELSQAAKLLELGIVRHHIVGRRLIRIGQKAGVPLNLKRTMGHIEEMEYENDWYRMGIWHSDCEIKMRDGTLHRVPASLFSWEGTEWERCVEDG